MEESKNEETWNKKRIFFAISLITLLIAGGYFFKTRLLSGASSRPAKSVEGINVKEKDAEPGLGIDVQGAVKEKIDSIKQQVLGLNIAEIASSSPQVQKIINDVQSLQQYPSNEFKAICKQICGL